MGFYNNGEKGSGRTSALCENWNLKRVVGVVKEDEVQDRCKDETVPIPGTRLYHRRLPKALGKVTEDLTEGEVEEFSKLASEWSKKSPPIEVQRR